jgi:hypothetical protein
MDPAYHIPLGDADLKLIGEATPVSVRRVGAVGRKTFSVPFDLGRAGQGEYLGGNAVASPALAMALTVFDPRQARSDSESRSVDPCASSLAISAWTSSCSAFHIAIMRLSSSSVSA